MILTWIVLGLAAGAAVAAIITYWNEIVDWAKETFNKIFSRGKLFIEWAGGKLRTWLAGINKYGNSERVPGVPQPASEEDLWKLYNEGVITYDELQKLLRGESISTNV